MNETNKQQLAWVLQKLAALQGAGLDRLRLESGLGQLAEIDAPQEALTALCGHLEAPGLEFLECPDRALLPLVCFDSAGSWGLVVNQDSEGNWVVLAPEGQRLASAEQLRNATARVKLLAMTVAFGLEAERPGQAAQAGQFKAHLRLALATFRPVLLEAVLASLVIGVLAMVTSLFSMQVYDRVIPTRGHYTLAILASGVLISILVELAMKYARSHVMDHVVAGLDTRLSREVFEQLLKVRVDQIPQSVGSLAAQIRGYEQVRSFYTSSTLYTLVDLPMGLLFIVVMALIGTVWVAAVPLVFGVVALVVGVSIRRRVMRLALDGARFSNMKTGLLVEAVEGVETIKAGSGGWKFLSRWIDVNQLTIGNDLKMRSATESVSYLSATIQQISYAGLVVVGAFEVMQGHMTMGGMIACSILSGRVLAPVTALPGLLVQQAHSKAAMESLERLYELQTDNHGTARPLAPSQIQGRFVMEDVSFAYGEKNPPAIQVPRLGIVPGERIAILGPIGAGKSTLLRLLSGMYQPQSGRVLLDGLEMSHISRHVISQQVGYLQQDHRLFQGSLRENLLIGLPDPGDDQIMRAMQRTGMDRFVAEHPYGLDRPIMEGGKGLSGGQKQLVAFTRLILCNPRIMLLDEPTATMDDEQERRCLAVLNEEAKDGKTLIIVTHKPAILPLVNRIIVIAGNGIVADGPRDLILKQLGQRNVPPTTNVVPVSAEV